MLITQEVIRRLLRPYMDTRSVDLGRNNIGTYFFVHVYHYDVYSDVKNVLQEFSNVEITKVDGTEDPLIRKVFR